MIIARMCLAVQFSVCLYCIAAAQTGAEHHPLTTGSVRVVAFSDSPAVGISGATYLTFNPPTMNERGNVLFGGRMTGSGIDWMNDDAVWVERNDTTIDLVAAEGTQASDAPPGTQFRGTSSFFSPFYSGLSQPILNANELVSFYAHIEGPAVGSSNGLWYFDQYGQALLGYFGQPVPQFGLTRMLGPMNAAVRLNSDGTLLTAIPLQNPPVNAFMRGTLPGGFEILDSAGIPLADFPPDHYSRGSDESVLNDDGTFACVRQIGWFNYYRGPAIYTNRSGSFAAAYSYLTEVPGGVQPDSFTYFGQLMMNRTGSLGFYGMTTQEGTNGKSGLWAESGGSLHNVMLNRTQAPGTPAGILFNSLTPGGNYPNDVYYTNDAQVIFAAYLTGPGVTLSNDAGVWRWKDGSLQMIMREGEQVPGQPAGVIFSRLDRLVVNEAGDLVLQAQVSGPGYSTANDEGLWTLDVLGRFRPVLLEGDRLPMSPGGNRTIHQIFLANAYYGLPSTGADGRAKIFTAGRKIALQARVVDGGITDDAILVADLSRTLSRRLPVLVKQRRPGQPDAPVANTAMHIGRFDPADPFNLTGFKIDTTDANGLLILDSTTFTPGESFLLLHHAFSRPTPKPGHTAVNDIMYDLKLDNLTQTPTGIPQPDSLRTAFEETTTTYLDHSTLVHNLIVSVEWPADRSYVDSLIRAFEQASEYLYDISNGQAYLGNIDIFDNGEVWNDADIRIHASNKEWPRANVLGVRKIGESMFLPPVWFGDERQTRLGVFNDVPLNPAGEINYRTIIHELGHLAFGFYDEYIDSANRPLRDGTTYGFMDSQYRNDNDPFTSEMSESSTPAGYHSTAQWQKNGKTCWDFFCDLFDTTVNGLRVQFRTPSEIGVPAGLAWIPGPNNIPGATDVAVSRATFVYGSSTGSSVPDFRPRFTFPGGRPMADADVTLQKTAGWRILSLGGTTDNGRIRTLGADAEDTVIAGARSGGRFYVGQIEVQQPGIRSRQPSVSDVVARPIAGSFRMISGVSFDAAGNTLFTTMFSEPHPSGPLLDLRGANLTPWNVQLTGDSLLYSATLPDTLPGDVTSILTATDSAGIAFRLIDHFSIHAIDSTTRLIVAGRSGVMLRLDTQTPVPDRIAVSTSSFPPPTTGIGDSLIQLSDVVSINARPPNTALHGTLTLTYDDLFDSVALRSVENVRIYRWTGTWTPVVTELDTMRNTAACIIEATGPYAAFLTPTIAGADTRDEGSLLPAEFRLEQNFPNPFNPSTTLHYSIPSRERVTIRVFDVLGRDIAVLTDMTQEAGMHSVVWSAGDYPSGVYFCELRAGSYTARTKMLLVR